jgi:hypothetical protein
MEFQNPGTGSGGVEASIDAFCQAQKGTKLVSYYVKIYPCLDKLCLVNLCKSHPGYYGPCLTSLRTICRSHSS